MITLSKGQFYGQPWVNSYGAAVPDEEIAPSPIPGYRGGFFLGEDPWAFVRPEVRSSAGGRSGAGSGACGRWGRGRSGLWMVSEGVVVVVRRLGEGWVDLGVGKWRSELAYRLWRNDPYSNGVSEPAVNRGR